MRFRKARYALWMVVWVCLWGVGVSKAEAQADPFRNNPNFQDPISYTAQWWAGLFEVFNGGRVGIVDNSNTTIEYTYPKGGVGGVTGGVLRVCSLRLMPIEERPTLGSMLGLELGASLVPVLDPAERLVLGTTVTRLEASRRKPRVI